MRRLETFLNEAPAPHSGVDCRIIWSEYWFRLLRLNTDSVAKVEADRKERNAA